MEPERLTAMGRLTTWCNDIRAAAVRRPYFETLIVTGLSSSRRTELAANGVKCDVLSRRSYMSRHSRKPGRSILRGDVNPNIEAVIINRRLSLSSRHNAACSAHDDESGLHESQMPPHSGLAHIIKRGAPSLICTILMSNRDVRGRGLEATTANAGPAEFYSHRRVLELHIDPGRHPGSLRQQFFRQSQENMRRHDRDVMRCHRARQIPSSDRMDP